jgi:hypothetical protein
MGICMINIDAKLVDIKMIFIITIIHKHFTATLSILYKLNHAKYATPKGHNEIRISLEEFTKKFNEGKAVLIDIRMPFEKKVWNLPFAIDIPADKLEKKIR